MSCQFKMNIVVVPKAIKAWIHFSITLDSAHFANCFDYSLVFNVKIKTFVHMQLLDETTCDMNEMFCFSGCG